MYQKLLVPLLSILFCFSAVHAFADDEATEKKVSGQIPRTLIVRVQVEKDKESDPVYFLTDFNRKVTDKTTAEAAIASTKGREVKLEPNEADSDAPADLKQLFEVGAKIYDNPYEPWRYYRPVGRNYYFYGYGRQFHYGAYPYYNPYRYPAYGFYGYNRYYPYAPAPYPYYYAPPYRYYYYYSPYYRW